MGDKNFGMLETISEGFPDTRYQCCIVHVVRKRHG
nr:hypothetical protein [Eubacterium sp. An11]